MAHPLLALQRQVGNRAVVEALGRSAAAGVERRSAAAEAGDPNERSQSLVVAAQAAAGMGLPPALRSPFESALGNDLSAVRLHAGPESARAARALGASAYTIGQDVHFAAGRYSPDSPGGLQLLAHELAHTVQLGQAPALGPGARLEVAAADDPRETEAGRFAGAFLGRSGDSGPAWGSGRHAAAQAIMRQTDPESPADGLAPGVGGSIPPEVQAVIDRVGNGFLLPLRLNLGPSSIEASRGWLAMVVGDLAAARATWSSLAEGAPGRAELAGAIAAGMADIAPSVALLGRDLREEAVAATNRGALLGAEASQPTLPSVDEVAALRDLIRALGEVNQEPLVSEPTLSAANEAIAAFNDGLVAVLQGRAVVGAREAWQTPVEEPAALTGADLSTDAGTNSRRLRRRSPAELDAIFADSGFNRYGVQVVPEQGIDRVADWCGMFAVSNLFRSGGLAEGIRSGFFDVANVEDFFHYRPTARTPGAIWVAEQGRWRDVEEYHEERQSRRQWWSRAEVGARLLAGEAPLRPGDVVLIDRRGGDRPHHITMVESYDAATRMLVTIEGNTHGLQSDGAGGLVADPGSSGTGIGLLPRDLGTVTPEVSTSLGSTGQQPGGGLVPVLSGATVFGVGRPSIVDFEDRPRLTNVPEGERATRAPE